MNKPLRILDTTEPGYIETLQSINYARTIGQEIGTYKRETYLFELVTLEVSLLAPLEVARWCGNMAARWCTERNPHIADMLTLCCHNYGFAPPPSVLQVITEAASLRLTGAAAGTADKLQNDAARGQAMILMANLIYNGDSLKDAASKAARWHRDNFPELKRLKASTLETYYVREFRRSGTEADLFKGWDRMKPMREFEGQPGAWRALSDSLPLADSELTGTRRR